MAASHHPARAALASLALAAFALTPAVAPTAAQAALHATWSPRPASYGAVKQTDVPVEMSDGNVLRVDVIRPALADGTAAPGRFPVILTQTPYNKSAPSLNFENDFLVQRGYVQVIADIRGTGSSPGEWSSFGEREQLDGAELVEWAHSRDRTWSNGKVGLYGVSYGAIIQFFTAAQHPAGLKAMFPIVPAGDVYRDVVASGGQIDAGFIPLWLGLVTATGLVPPAYTATSPDQGVQTLVDHLTGAYSFQASTVGSAVSGSETAYDGEFYATRSPLNVVDEVDVPTFVVGGEYDLFQRGEPMLYERLRSNGVPTRFVDGPWTHLQASAGAGLENTPLQSMDAASLRWFDKYLGGRKDTRLMKDIAPVTYYEIGSGAWRTAKRWMPSDVHAETFQLDGAASPGTPGALVPGAPTADGADDLYPVPVTGLCSRSASQWTAGIVAVPGCEDNQYNDLAGDSYQTAPLTKDLHLMGPINATLYVSSQRPDAMVSVHVESVAPDGTVDRLTGGWQVISHRAVDRSRSRFLDGRMVQPFHLFTQAAQQPAASDVMRVDVEVFPTGAVIPAGHSLRITVQQYDTPHLLPTVPEVVDGVGNIVTLHHSSAYPSQIVLPVRG